MDIFTSRLLQTLISKRAELYRSRSELRAANSRLVKGLRVMDKKRFTPQNTKVRKQLNSLVEPR